MVVSPLKEIGRALLDYFSSTYNCYSHIGDDACTGCCFSSNSTPIYSKIHDAKNETNLKIIKYADPVNYTEYDFLPLSEYISM
ncbi:hypothetical protein GCM10023262_13780 [Bartonella pachyuromydis]|uniref:Uncharacterized protein n=1 Tax=Bartonella pachyuromydis TaxID=931097 RepID=A0ABP8VJW5_9HYPH